MSSSAKYGARGSPEVLSHSYTLHSLHLSLLASLPPSLNLPLTLPASLPRLLLSQRPPIFFLSPFLTPSFHASHSNVNHSHHLHLLRGKNLSSLSYECPPALARQPDFRPYDPRLPAFCSLLI